MINTVVSLFESGKKPCLRLSNVAKNYGEIIVFPHLNTLWIITVIHSAYLFFFHVFFLFFIFFSNFLFFLFFFSFLFSFFFTKWCGEITVSPHPNTLWITTVIHCAFLFFFFKLSLSLFFVFFVYFFSNFPFFSFFFFFFPKLSLLILLFKY